MNKIILKYLLKNFLSKFLLVFIVVYFFGIILNLFEEIEFFKNENVSFILPLVMTIIYIPSLLIKISPFIIFVSSMFFVINIRNNQDLLILKVFGYSNLKIFFILAFTAFLIGWSLLLIITPITSNMAKQYEKTKANYSRDIDHLVTFNKNGLWIKENQKNSQRIITAKKPVGIKLTDLTIFNLDNNANLISKITAKEANIESNNWELNEVIIFKPENDILVSENKEIYKIKSIYNYEKINSLFKNFDTMSFLDILVNKNKLSEKGYNEFFLNQNLHTMLALPFFCFIMTAIASIFTLNTLKKTDNLRYSFLGLITCIFVFYFKDLSLALGQTSRMPLILSIWTPVITLSFFIFIGLLQINEK